jgi:catechol 2,3-dioxygenase-like lactoylglutathione lyase family enzyme
MRNHTRYEENMLKIGHIELFVNNPLKSKDFYVDVLGFELVTVQDDQFVWVKSGDMEILLRPGKPIAQSENYEASKSGIVLYSDDVGSTADEFRARGLSFAGTDGSDTCLTFTDPDGHWFQLVNPNYS